MTTMVARQCVFIRASAVSVWKAVSNLKAWPDWYPIVKAVEIDSESDAGVHGRFFLKSGPATLFTIVGVQEEKFIRVESPLFWLKLTQEIRMVQISEGTVVTFELNCSGALQKLSARLLEHFLAQVPEKALVRLKTATERLVENQVLASNVTPISRAN